MIQKRVKTWTQEEDRFVIDHYLNMSDEEIGKELQRSEHAIRSRRNLLKLKRPRAKIVIKNKSNKKITFDDVKQLFKERGYILLSNESEYHNQASKLRYLCPKHLDKGELLIDYGHLKQNRGCYYCGRERTILSRKTQVTEKEDKELCDIKGFEYIKTEKKDGKYTIFFYCPKHKDLGIQSMTRGNMNREEVRGCQYCSCKNLPPSYIKETIEHKYPHIKVISKYSGMNEPLTCYCTKHNNTFTREAKYIFYKAQGCKYCSSEKLSNSSRLPDDVIINRIREANPEVEVVSLDKYLEDNRPITVRCIKCGYIWDVPYHSMIVNHTQCPNCSSRTISKGEQRLIDILKDNNYNYSTQYKIDECRYKYPLPFDNALLDENNNLLCLFEYQGEQHYKPIKYFGGKNKFEETQLRDKIKQEYCKNNNIPLLIIPYWDYDNMEEIVKDFIDNL